MDKRTVALADPHPLDVQRGVADLAFSSDGRALASLTVDGAVLIGDLTSGTVQQTWSVPGARCLVFLPGRPVVVVGTGTGRVVLVDARTGTVTGELGTAAAAGVRCLAVSADGRRLAAGSEDGTVRTWDESTGRVAEVRSGAKRINAVTFLRGGTLVAVAASGRDGTVRLHDSDGLREVHQIKAHRRAVTDLAADRDGNILLTASLDSTAKVWDASSAALIEPLEHGAPVWGVACTSGAEFLATFSGLAVPTVRLWTGPGDIANTRTAMHRGSKPLGFRPAKARFRVAFSPDDGALAAAHTGGSTVSTWRLAPVPTSSTSRHHK